MIAVMPSTGQSNTLTGTTTPTELLNWVNEWVTQSPKLKDTLFTAQEVVDFTLANDWELANLVYIELSSMGYNAQMYYIERRNAMISHSCVFYNQPQSPWMCFDTNPFSGSLIYGPFGSLGEAVYAMKTSFEARDFSFKHGRLGTSVITPDMHYNEYIDMVRKWAVPPYFNPYKSKYR